MSARSGRWDLLGHDSDPVPADYWDVREVSRKFRDKQAALEDAWTTLDKLSRLDGWKGEAAETFAVHAHDGLGALGKAKEKYGMAAAALESYADDVTTARDGSQKALDRAEEAEARRVADQHSLLDGVKEPTDEQKADDKARDQRHAAAVGDLAAAAKALGDALDDLDEAARRCAGDIQKASDHDKDGWFDDFKGFIRDHADLIKKIVEVLEWIAIAVAAIALIAAIILSGGTLLAVLAVVGVALAVVLLAAHASMMAAGVDGVGWGDIAMDLVSIVSFGAGKLLSKGAQAAIKGAQSAVAANAANAARSALPNTVKNALKIADDANTLKVWARGRVVTAMDDAESFVDTQLKVSTSIASRIATLGREEAENLAKLKVLQNLGGTANVEHLMASASRQTIANILRGSGDLAMGVDETVGKIWDQIETPVDHLKNGIDHAVDAGLDSYRRLEWRITVAGR